MNRRKPRVMVKTSPNYSRRRGRRVEAIVLHHTGPGTTSGLLEWLCTPNSGVSAHYLISPDGVIYQLVQDEMAAWHAGFSSLHGEEAVNSRSIGIELVHAGKNDVPFDDQQYGALEALLRYLVDRYSVPPENLVGHRDIAPGRKFDPADSFDWERVRLAVYG